VEEPPYPVFCGRWEFTSQFRDLISSSIEDMLAPQLFVIPVPRQDPTPPAPPGPQFGSERLLREFAAETVRAGHIPILLSKGFLGVPHKQWPNELDEFLRLYFIKAVDETIQILSGKPPLLPLRSSPRLENLGRLKPALFDQPPDGQLPKEIRFINDPAQRLAAAIFSDLLALRAQVCELRKVDAKTADVKVVLLIEDYHDFEYGDVLAELFRRFGLKDGPARGLTRAVVTFNRIPVDSQPTTTTVIKDFTASTGVITRELTALHSPITSTSKPAQLQEATLVYRQFLLGWQDRETPTPLSLWSRGDKDTALMETFSEVTSGWPSEIAGRAFWATILTLVRQRAPELRPANDEDVINAESAMPWVREG
jgi:hypothetical protein